ncbi:hypothetical protein CWE09_08385 [Aliidiomarina minuta]|uniref:DUF6436 domain-containing protein n=1 Tax=Aliidiomarina minuta TaxID=880057 RepID=A0A432W974_9GAMM|nr:DUF6436 domain-containing protein [Aliidiomarina minuta]RUO26703.1 hypothetical protein CWE09_08385 [Aliidiomarina minuta]
MNNRHWLALAVIVIWLVASTLAMYWFTFSDYGEFDPEQEWLGTPASLQLAQLGIAQSDVTEMHIVHVQQKDCSCNRYVNTHIEVLSAQPQLNEIQQHRITPEQVEQAGFRVPATPMALIFQGQELLYAGPYATGPFCAVDDSLISDVLKGTTRLAGGWLNGLVKSCRCLQ